MFGGLMDAIVPIASIAAAPFTGGASLAAGAAYMGASMTNKTNAAIASSRQAFDAQQAQQQMDFQQRNSDTSYQRAVNDMKLAGLNPMLAYSQGGASTPTGAAAQIPQDTEKRARWVFDRCTAWWRAYGVQPYRLRYRPHLELPKTTVMPSDVQSRLQWLERQVAPSIAWLTQQGYRASVLAALGLSNDALEQ